MSESKIYRVEVEDADGKTIHIKEFPLITDTARARKSNLTRLLHKAHKEFPQGKWYSVCIVEPFSMRYE